MNEYIRSVNERSSESRKTPLSSPRYKLDLLKFRKEKGGKQRVSINFSNYKDGIHPTCLLARCLMKRIVTQVLIDCSLLACFVAILWVPDESREGLT